MRLFYLISSVLVTVFVLVLSFAQVGATCSWYLFDTNTPPFIVLLEMSITGAVVGGLLVLWWKSSKEGGSEPSDGE